MGVRSRVCRVGAAALMVPAVVGAQAGAPATSALPAPVQAVPVPTAPVHATESPVQPFTAPAGSRVSELLLDGLFLDATVTSHGHVFGAVARPGGLIRTTRSCMRIDRGEPRTRKGSQSIRRNRRATNTSTTSLGGQSTHSESFTYAQIGRSSARHSD